MSKIPGRDPSSGIIRIIETGYSLGGQLKRVYVFCLPPWERERGWNVLPTALTSTGGPQGILQLVNDAAGVLVYMDEERTTGAQLCESVTARINDVLDTSLVYDPSPTDGSIWSVTDYRQGTYDYLIANNARFRLPYMLGQ